MEHGLRESEWLKARVPSVPFKCMATATDRFQRHLGRLTIGVLAFGLGLFALAVACALLGFPHAVSSFRSAAAAVGVVFTALFAAFMLSSLVAAVVRWFDRRARRDREGA